MELLGSSSNTIDGHKDREFVPKLEVVKFVLVHCNLIILVYRSK